MKKRFVQIVLICIFITIIINCSKKSSAAPDLKSTFKFTGNDTLLEWDGQGYRTGPGGGNITVYTEGSIITYSSPAQGSPAYYQLLAYQGGNTNYTPQISLSIITTNLNVGIYTQTKSDPAADSAIFIYTDDCLMPNSAFLCSANDDFVTVNVTSIHDSYYADGTFKAQMSNAEPGGTAKLAITNGEFHNVRIVK